MLGVITGTGLYQLGKLKDVVRVDTPYGAVKVNKAKLHDEEFYYIARHGEGHTIPPHKINYRANVAALKKLGVDGVISIFSAGIISGGYKPGDFVLLEDFIGFNAPITFYDDFALGIRHTDFSVVNTKNFVKAVDESAFANKIKLKKGGIIATTVGPRYETKAEVEAIKKMGANLVDMTSAYEMTLVNEIEIEYCPLAIAANYACGITNKPLRNSEVLKLLKDVKLPVEGLIHGVLDYVNEE
ncbi:MAG: MTAP family purine nucleoside phosphorylase [Candidatus Micrarchaeota archaeon]